MVGGAAIVGRCCTSGAVVQAAQPSSKDHVKGGDGVPVAVEPLPAQGVGSGALGIGVPGKGPRKGPVPCLPVGLGGRQAIGSRAGDVDEADLADNELLVVDGDLDLAQYVAQPAGIAQGQGIVRGTKELVEQDRAFVGAGGIPGALLPGGGPARQEACHTGRGERVWD